MYAILVNSIILVHHYFVPVVLLNLVRFPTSLTLITITTTVHSTVLSAILRIVDREGCLFIVYGSCNNRRRLLLSLSLDYYHRRRCLSRHTRFVVVQFHTMKRNNVVVVVVVVVAVVVVVVVAVVVGIAYAIQSRPLRRSSPV